MLSQFFCLVTAQTTIAVIDFDARNISAGEVATLTDRFRDELTKTNRYTVIERGKMEEVLKEQGFQQSGCASDECVVEVGQLIGVQQMVGGSIGKVGNVFTLSIRIIEVESGEIIQATNYDHIGDIGQLLMEGMEKAAQQLLVGSIVKKSEVIDIKADKVTPTSESRDTGTVTDIDGNVYQTVEIGDQWWMAENLRVTHYRNGDNIRYVSEDEEWFSITTGAYCSYDNDYLNISIYGQLYNWYTINDSRNIAPEGWHVPSNEEWMQLEMYLGMSQAESEKDGWRGTNEGSKLKEIGTTHWNSPNTDVTNESGFTALPGGYRLITGSYSNIGSRASFWSSTEVGDGAWWRALDCEDSGVGLSYGGKLGGYSIRCVKD